MAIFKNNTLHPIKIIVNGIRKTLNPGTIIQGPDGLGTIPGLTLIDKSHKPILPKLNTNIPTKIKEPEVSQPHIKFNTNSTSIHDCVTQEHNHLQEYISFGQNPSVSIAILTKNSLPLIKECCQSIFSFVKYNNTTIVIIDTGSTEPVVYDYYKSVKDQCIKYGFGYKLIQLNMYHFSKNYNEVINKYINTDYVIIQNNDTIARNDYVTEMMRLTAFRKVGSVGARLYYPNGKIQHDGQHIFDGAGHISGPGHLNVGLIKSQIPETHTRNAIVDGNTAACVLVKTSDYKKIDGFDEAYGDIFQDVDLMVKLQNNLKKYNICNRNAELTHIDNASRFQKGVDKERVKVMWQDSAYLKTKYKQLQWKKYNIEHFDFSIVTLVNDINEYKKLTDSLKNQSGTHNIEIVSIANFHNIYKNVAKAFNDALDICTGKYVIFLHQDIILPKDWLDTIKQHIKQCDIEKIKWGVLGPAGVTLDNIPYYYLLNGSMNKLHELQKPKNEVFCLDELCLILNKQHDLRFTEALNGFHFYGCDICIQSLKKGLHNFAIDAYCYHNSIDGKKNLSTQESYNTYVDNAKRFDIIAKQNGYYHWRTTTAMGVHNNILFFISPPDYNGNGIYSIKV